ncbi:MAG: RelB/DinJ family addiction module antitoxin [Coriobacteriia bacterium]|nr:RelB/DinJ family addiction module antitoxin [Coriobacteriia bacterium]
MDGMVTARMSQGKKEAGDSILRNLGTNPSRFINDSYDYVITHGQLPFFDESIGKRKYNIQEAMFFIDSIPLPASDRFSSITDDQIMQERLIARGLVPEGYFE